MPRPQTRARFACSFHRLALSVLLVALPAGEASAQTRAPLPALRIVVLEGEDAVNIIQQRTAVAPVVEVRDRNDQPVAGAVVSFTIRGGRASFNGARVLTVTTNATGRAVATGLTPTGSGALQIGASAVYQGQTAALTIAQTNVATAAEAAAASGAAGGAATPGALATTAATGAAGAGAAAAGGASTAAAGAAVGGGLPLTAIGIAGAAVAGGTYVATKATGNDPQEAVYAGTFASQFTVQAAQPNGVPICTYTNANEGLLTLRLDGPGSGAVSGLATIAARWSVLSSACGPTPAPGPFFDGTIDNVPLGGSASNLTFSWTNTGPGSNNVTVTHSYAFTGTLSAGTVTGTLAYTYRGVLPNGASESGATQMAVTLR